MIEVDGSYGEGGGQILRTAVVFSCILGEPVRVFNVRAGRKVPGLRQQHMSAIQTLGRIFGAELKGCSVGSNEILFSPGRQGVSSVVVDMRTAGSITLLLQAVIPAVALTHSRVALEITGGTDVPWSPTFDYFSLVVRRAYDLIGIKFEATAKKRGYYPRGGGKVSAKVESATSLRAVQLTAPTGPAKIDLASRCGLLPRHVAERQLEAMNLILSSAGLDAGSRTQSEEKSDSPGSSVLACVADGGLMLGADGLGAKGTSAEEIGKKAAESLVLSLRSGASVDSNLADMISPLLSLAENESSLLAPQVSLHLKTGLHVAKLFTGCDYSFVQTGRAYLITVRPVSGHNA